MKRGARMSANDEAAAPRCCRNRHIADEDGVLRQKFVNRVEHTFPWSHRAADVFAKRPMQRGYFFTIVEFRLRLQRLKQPDDGRDDRFRIAYNSDRMRKIPVDRVRIGIDTDMFCRRSEAPV